MKHLPFCYVAREEEPLDVSKGGRVSRVSGEFVLCVLFDVSTRINTDSIIRIGG